MIDRQRIAAARLWAAHRYPYLASALFASRIISVPGINTVAVDRSWRLYLDPALVDAWSVDQLGSVFVHHTGHLLRDHAGRAETLGVDKDTAKQWTSAADAEINDDLVDEHDTMPMQPVLPQSFGLEPGKLAEEYYQALLAEKHDHEHSPECGSGSDDQSRAWDEPSDAGAIGRNSAHLLRCQVADDILKCRNGLLPGTVPLGMIRWAEEFLNSKIDWRRVLAAELRRGIANVAGRVDYTYSRPSRRQTVSKDVILPALRRPVPEVAIVIDTSGSMSGTQLGQVLAEVEGMLRSVGLGRNRLRVLTCDAAVHTVRRVSSARQIELAGGGGTNMGEGIEQASLLRPRPSVVVVLTDGYTPWPLHPPKGLEVVIGLIGTAVLDAPDWARVVRIEDVA